jgi:hypothetical protein
MEISEVALMDLVIILFKSTISMFSPIRNIGNHDLSLFLI